MELFVILNISLFVMCVNNSFCDFNQVSGEVPLEVFENILIVFQSMLTQWIKNKIRFKIKCHFFQGECFLLLAPLVKGGLWF